LTFSKVIEQIKSVQF